MLLKKYGKIPILTLSQWLIWAMLFSISSVHAQPCIDVQHSSDGNNRNICSCVWSDTESYDVGILHVDSTNQFTGQYDQVAQSLLVGEYFPISGDLLSDDNTVNSKKQVIRYDAAGNVQSIISYAPPFLDEQNNIAEVRLQSKGYESDGTIRGSSIYSPSSAAIGGMLDKVHIFRNPTEENEFFSCTTDDLGFFVSSSEQSFSIEDVPPLDTIEQLTEGSSCKSVTFTSPAQDDRYQNLCRCVLEERVEIYTSLQFFGNYSGQATYDVGLLRNVHQIRAPYAYDNLDIEMYSYIPISGDYTNYDISVESKKQFERYDATTGKVIEIASYEQIHTLSDKLRVKEYNQQGQLLKNTTSIFDNIALKANTTYTFKNPSKENEFFSCSTNSDGYFVSASEPFSIDSYVPQALPTDNDSGNAAKDHTCAEVSYDTEGSNVCRCIYDYNDTSPISYYAYDAGFLKKDDSYHTVPLHRAYDGILTHENLPPEDYTPITGDVVGENDRVLSTQQVIRYDDKGRIIEIFSHAQPVVDSNNMVIESKVDIRRPNADGSFTKTTESINTLTLEPNSTYIFRVPATENEFFACETNSQGIFSAAHEPFTIDRSIEQPPVEEEIVEHTCEDVVPYSPTLEAEKGSPNRSFNTCGCKYTQDSGQPTNYEVGMLYNNSMAHVQFWKMFDDVAASMYVHDYSPIMGDAMSSEASIQSKRQFERYDSNGKVMEILTYAQPVLEEFSLDMVKEAKLHSQTLNSDGSIVTDTTSTIDSIGLKPNETYIFKAPFGENQFFSCNTNAQGDFISANKPFTIDVQEDEPDNAEPEDNDNPPVDNTPSETPTNTGSGSVTTIPSAPTYHMLSVSGSAAHIRSTPAGIDCAYGSGTCSKSFKRGTSVKLDVIEIKTAVGLSQNDYNIEWDGNHHSCASQMINLTSNVGCMVRVYGKPGVDDSQGQDTDTTEPVIITPVVNSVRIVNFSAHSQIKGGARDLMLGFLLEGDDTSDLLLHAYILDKGVLPKLELRKLKIAENSNISSSLLQRRQQPSDFTFGNNVSQGIYTLTMGSAGTHGRGMTGITLQGGTLKPSLLSARGYVSRTQPLVFNMIAEGKGTQKVRVRQYSLDGNANANLFMLNMHKGETVGTGQVYMSTEISAGTYAIVLFTHQGEGINMIQVELP